MTRSHLRRGFGRFTISSALLVALGVGAATPARAATPELPPLFYTDPDPSKTSNDLGAVFVNMADRLSKETPSGTRTPRENAYSGLCLVLLGFATKQATNLVGIPAFGGALGTLAGTLGGLAIGSAFAGIGAVGGAAMFAPLGFSVGVSGGLVVAGHVSLTELMVAGIFTMYAVDHIEAKYPPTAALDRGSSGGTAFAYIPSSRNAALWSSAGSKYADKYESLFVYLVDAMFTDKLVEISDKWDAMPGLTDAQRAQLREWNVLRPRVKQLAYIKKHHRVAPGAKPAQPLVEWAATAAGIIRGDEASIRNAWMKALGVGEVALEIKDGQIRIKPGKVLRDVGAPETISASLPTIGKEVSALGNKLRASLKPGDFSASVGSAELIESGSDAGKVKVKFSVPNGSTIARGRVDYSGPAGSGGVNASLKLSRSVNGAVILKFSGRRLKVDRVDVDGLSASAAIDGVPGPFSGLASDLSGKLAGAAGNAFDKDRFLDAFKQLSDRSDESLLIEVTKRAKMQGYVEVAKIDLVEWKNGALEVHVEGKRIGMPELSPAAVLAAAWSASSGGKAAPSGKTKSVDTGMPGKGAMPNKPLPPKGW
jgi:hypothetical protein